MIREECRTVFYVNDIRIYLGGKLKSHFSETTLELFSEEMVLFQELKYDKVMHGMRPWGSFLLRLKEECTFDVQPKDVKCRILVFQAGEENDKEEYTISDRPNLSVSI